MQKVIEFIEYYHLLSPEAKEDIRITFEAHEFRKNEIIVEAGKACKRLYFVNEGACRTFYYQEGKEVTSWIYPEKEMVTNWSAFINQREASENIQVIMPSECYSISYEQLLELRQKHRDIDRFWTKYMEDQICFMEESFHGFLFNTAKERYDALIKYFPDVTRVANLGYIASMLGVTQETLSRIRKMV